MPYRKTVLAQNEFYHVFNRGVASLPIFSLVSDYLRFLELVNYYHYANVHTSFSLFKKLTREERSKILSELMNKNDISVEIHTFCLMPNHLHFLLRQIDEKGITIFMSRLQNGYAKYFNIKNGRPGPLFQPMFGAVRIQSEEQLLHVSRYIHLNPSTGYVVKIAALPNYKWSSLPTYLGINDIDLPFLSKETILDLAGGEEKYKEFVFNQAEYQRKLGRIKHLLLE